ncbi:MAG: sigma-54 interaction domain-containing protein [Spirochaetota bacterium]
MQEILLTFVGNRDPFPPGADAAVEEETGPILSLLRSRAFSRVILFCTGSDYIERGRDVERAARELGLTAAFKFVTIELSSPIDHAEIYRELSGALESLHNSIAHQQSGVSVLLDPGTPQMQTAWFLLVASGRLRATLLQGIPARFAGGAYKVRQVDGGPELFPGIPRYTSPPLGVSQPEAGGRSSARAPSPPRADVPQWIRSWRTTIVGQSPALLNALEHARNYARYDMTVMIRGETGTGKELVARLIHEESGRSNAPFVAVNCAAISAGLTESELFGHEKGAFTGAERSRLGQFRAADGGTIFLDEVGDLPAYAQAKLLRVIENQTVTPVGSDTEVQVDVRILAATNRDLEQQIADGSFRRDLHERLAAVTVYIPALRERPDDIPMLLSHFISIWNERYGEAKGLSEEVVQYLSEYPWPGNVRELKNAVDAMLAMGNSDHIGPELLPRTVKKHFDVGSSDSLVSAELPDEGLDLRAVLHNTEKEYYLQALERSGGNAEQAARMLGLQGPAFRKAARERLGIEWREREG